MTLRLLVGTLIAATALTCFAACSTSADSCTPGEERCSQGMPEVCTIDGASGGFGSGFVYPKSLQPRDDHSSDPSGGGGTGWSVMDHCASPSLCVQPKGDHPFCALQSEPLAVCAGTAKLACAGTTGVTCRSGYAVEELAFETCPSTAGRYPGDTSCAGSANDLPIECGKGYLGDLLCMQDSDCAAGLSCIAGPNGGRMCTKHCDPAAGDGNAACAPFHQRAGEEGMDISSCSVDGVCL
jgi:hypothetical protein